MLIVEFKCCANMVAANGEIISEQLPGVVEFTDEEAPVIKKNLKRLRKYARIISETKTPVVPEAPIVPPQEPETPEGTAAESLAELTSKALLKSVIEWCDHNNEGCKEKVTLQAKLFELNREEQDGLCDSMPELEKPHQACKEDTVVRKIMEQLGEKFIEVE